MLKFKTILSPLALSIALSFSASSFAGLGHQGDKQGNKQALKQILQQLDLSVSQKQDIRQLFKQNREDRGLYREDMRELKAEIKALMRSAEWDQQAAETIFSQRIDLVAGIALKKAMSKNQLWNLLSPEQQAEFNQIHEQRKAEANRDRTPLKFLEKLDLSAEQQVSIDTIRNAQLVNQEAFKQKRDAFKQEEKSLIQAELFSEQAWQGIREKYQDDFMNMQLNKAQSKHDVWHLLTAEQQAQLEEMKEQRRERKSQERKRRLG
jgi:Spy/CpxP family protein refolding chaperone